LKKNSFLSVSIALVFFLFFNKGGYLFLTASESGSTIEWKKIHDPQTGYEVWQMTDGDSGSVGFYFERQAFTADDRYIVFTSNRTGTDQLFRADLVSGIITQLTDLPDVTTGNMHPDGKHCLFQSKESLLWVNVASGQIETIIDGKHRFPSLPYWSGSYTSDGKYTAVSCQLGEETKMYLVDITQDQIKPVLNWKGRYSHLQINPKYPNLISFVPGPDTQNNMTLPMEKRARTWKVNTETGNAKQFLTCPYGFRATHESWSADGERFYFFKKSVPGWVPVSICSINKEGKDWREYYTHHTIRLGHGISSPYGNWFISDGQDKNKNPLILININTGKGKFICWPNASIAKGQDTHVHPSFSSSGEFVYFTSDRSGKPQVYVMKIPYD
jgi:Tol biopolymer transport system component